MPRRPDGLDSLFGDSVPDQKTHPLDYASGKTSRWAARPLVAFLLCLPGSLCWLVLFAPDLLSPSWPFSFTVIMTLWALAVITAIASIVFYWRKPKLWFVVMCLFINVCGLLYSVLVLTLLLRP